MHVALATYHDLPDREVDDLPFHTALAARGIDFTLADWHDTAVDWSAFDACLIRTTWDYQKRLGEFLAWAEGVARVSRLFNPFPIVRWNTHKSYLRELASEGIPTIPTVWLDRGAPVDVARIMAERDWSRGFIKPAVGATAWRTLRFAAATDLQAAQAHAEELLADGDLLLQPYLARVETEGELSAIFIDGRLSHAVRKVPVHGDYRVQDDFGAHDEPATLAPDEIALAERAIRVAGTDLLYGRTDFLRADDGSLVLTELELVEPSMFFRHAPQAPDRLADALRARL